ncbi:sodium/nucleoside cotransporter 1 isoform X3 [Nannospalax galili]|uniref:sodium/nucleoside cotransporter 1 isoform X3 n=1 Tax=Nannospalax galili TaxID=1026970 RepID=UPI00111BDC01|nr:sodium/nucleoside cotransporter 1 isoform X3 [Nannospalax galili]
MADDTAKQRESISLPTVAHGLENLGAEFLESLEEGRLPGMDSRHEEGGHSWNKAEPKPFSRWRSLQPAVQARSFCREHKQLFQWICKSLLCIAYIAFLLIACLLDFQRALALLVITCVVLVFLAYSLLKRLLGPKLRCAKLQGHSRLSLWLKRGLALAAGLGLILWLSLDTSQRPEQLVSFAGICVFLTLLFAGSKHHRAVSWRAVAWGLGLQFVLGLFVIRTEPGFVAFQWLGDQIQVFLSYTEAGSRFVFGEALVKDIFAFQVLPIIVFFSCVMSVLYYLGLMQWVILKIAWLMQVTMGTSATETLSVAGNIFVSQTEAPLLIRPYLADMTLSEVHVVMTGGYATIAGSLLGAYIAFGIDAASLIAASVMAAPCALALSKLVYPEVEESKFRSEEGVKLTYGDAQNLVEAASAGAAISVRAEILTTFALCGFANFSSIGIMLGGLTSLVPQRRSDFSKIVIRALITGAFVSLVNACVAGILYVPRGPDVDCVSLLNQTLSSSSFEVYQCCHQVFQSTSSEFSPEALENCCQFYNHTICT